MNTSMIIMSVILAVCVVLLPFAINGILRDVATSGGRRKRKFKMCVFFDPAVSYRAVDRCRQTGELLCTVHCCADNADPTLADCLSLERFQRKQGNNQFHLLFCV